MKTTPIAVNTSGLWLSLGIAKIAGTSIYYDSKRKCFVNAKENPGGDYLLILADVSSSTTRDEIISLANSIVGNYNSYMTW